jgi:hypothetical protein
MIIFLITGTIVGIMLGFRFKVAVLGPAILLATAVITLTGIASGHEARAILTMFGTAASLQIGYLAGGILRAVVSAHPLAGTTAAYRSSTVGIVPNDIESESVGAAQSESLGSEIGEGEQRHDELYDANLIASVW